MKLKMGKFYRVASGHYLWKTDKMAPELNQGNKQMTILLPETMVMVTKNAQWRYIQVVYEDMIGYVWCATNVPVYEHFREVDPENEDEQERKSKQFTFRQQRIRS